MLLTEHLCKETDNNMKSGLFNRKHTHTAYIQLDTRKCQACWKCIENCANEVISKVDFQWHRHALIADPGACTGCLSCIDICPHGAYTTIDEAKQETEKQRNKIFYRFLINNLLLFFSIMTTLSGLVLQAGFHMGGLHGSHGEIHDIPSRSANYEQIREIDPYKIVWGFNYSDWSSIHKFSIVFFSLFMIYHFYIHWKWYTTVVSGRLIIRNLQVMTLSVLFLLVAITGFSSWLIDLSGNKSILRLVLIEVHDKLTLILIIYFVLHIVKRNKWYVKAFKNIVYR